MGSIVLCLAGATMPAAAAADERARIWFDTDIGTGIDDAFALGYLLASPNVDLRGVTTVGGQAEDRAWMVCRFLTHVGRKDVPVGWGRDKQPDGAIDWQIQYRRHPAVVWNRTAKPSKTPAVEMLFEALKAEPGKITIVACGPLTNVAAMLEKHPEAKGWVKRVVFVPNVADQDLSNVAADLPAMKAVLATGVPLTVVPATTTALVTLDEASQSRLFSARTAVTYQVQSLYELWDRPTPPPLAAALAVAVAAGENVGTIREIVGVEVEAGPAGSSTKISYNAQGLTDVDAAAFAKRYVERLAGFGPEILPKEPGNVSKLIDRGAMPVRVHAFEDYETDIEKRWWMTGKVETKDVPAGSKRACRAVLTQDYDDLQGDMRAMYRAVIFNPVPGPPMGKNTRLSFRYKLHGTGTMRVQLFSLANGYHRYLSLKDLPQDKWMEGAVDMTQMRRPDGTGGPLAEDERIDDIQFYVDPRAEMLIDDIVLYEAGVEGEGRGFPKRILFTGWFDTGKQGQEWPGQFDIVPHDKPLTWKAARSTVDSKTGLPVLRIGLRGGREPFENTRLVFRYRLTADAPADVDVVLDGSRSGIQVTQTLKATPGGWHAAALDYRFEFKGCDMTLDRIAFDVPKGMTFEVDDVLLYEPAKP